MTNKKIVHIALNDINLGKKIREKLGDEYDLEFSGHEEELLRKIGNATEDQTGRIASFVIGGDLGDCVGLKERLKMPHFLRVPRIGVGYVNGYRGFIYDETNSFDEYVHIDDNFEIIPEKVEEYIRIFDERGRAIYVGIVSDNYEQIAGSLKTSLRMDGHCRVILSRNLNKLKKHEPHFTAVIIEGDEEIAGLNQNVEEIPGNPSLIVLCPEGGKKSVSDFDFDYFIPGRCLSSYGVSYPFNNITGLVNEIASGKPGEFSGMYRTKS